MTFGGTPSGIKLDALITGVWTDLTALAGGRKITFTRAQPGQASRMQTYLWKSGGGTPLVDMADLTRMRAYDVTGGSGAAYPRYFDGFMLGANRHLDGNGNLGLDVDCVGWDWRWKNPAQMLTTKITYGYLEWLPNHPYLVGDKCVRITPDGHKYNCTTAGTSGATEPSFNTGAGTTTTESTGVVWTENGAQYVSDYDVITDLLPRMFDAEIVYTLTNHLIADVGYMEFTPDMTPDDCMQKIAEKALSSTYDPWAALTNVVRGDLREAAPATGYYFQCIKTGTTQASSPLQTTTTLGTEVADGSARWVCMGATSVVPDWQLLTLPDNAGHTAPWAPSVYWFDVNSTVSVPTLTVEYADIITEDSTHVGYRSVSNSRTGTAYFNRVNVRGQFASYDYAEDVAQQTLVGRVVTMTYVDDSADGPGTNSDCKALANHILGQVAQFEDRVQLVSDTALDPLAIRALAFGKVTAALLGLSAERYPLTNVQVDLSSGQAVWTYELGAAFRVGGQDVLSRRLGGRRVPGDFTAPALVTYPVGWVLSNVADPATGLVTLVLGWNSGNEPDLKEFWTEYLLAGDTYRRMGPRVQAPRQVVTFEGLPPGVRFTMWVLAKDTSDNPRNPREADWSQSPNINTAIVLPQPPTALAVDTAWTWGILGYYYDGQGHAQVRLTFTPPGTLPTWYLLQVYLDTSLISETRWPGASTGVISPPLVVGDTYSYRVYSQIADVRSPTYASLGPLVVPAPPSTDIINPGFEYINAGAGSGIRGWTTTTLSGGTAGLDPTPHTGLTALKLVTTGAGSSTAQCETTDLIAAHGATEALSFWARTLFTGTLKWTVTCYNWAGTLLGSPITGTQVLTPSYPDKPYTVPVPLLATTAYKRIKFEPNGLSQTVYVDDVSMVPQVPNAGIADLDGGKITPGSIPAGTLMVGAVLPGNTNNGVPYLENPSLEIPNIAGTMPAGWDYNNSGTLVYNQTGTGAGMDGKCSVVLGGGVGTHRFQGPKVPWTYGRRIGIDLSFWYILSTLTGTTVTFGLAQYDRTGAYISDAIAVDPGGGSLSWAAGTATFQRGFKSQSVLDLTTAYVAPYVKLVVASGTGNIEVDNFRLDEQGQTMYAVRVQGGSATGGDTGPYVDLVGTTVDAISASGVKLGSTGSTPIRKVLSTTATLDFPSTLSRVSSDLTVTVTGAAAGDHAEVTPPNGSVTANAVFTAWVSAADTVKVRFYNGDAAAQNPASGSFRVVVLQW